MLFSGGDVVGVGALIGNLSTGGKWYLFTNVVTTWLETLSGGLAFGGEPVFGVGGGGGGTFTSVFGGGG